MSNTQKNPITLRVIEKKNINGPIASQKVTVAEVTRGAGQFKEGYIVIAAVKEDTALADNIVNVPYSSIMAVVGASLREYA